MGFEWHDIVNNMLASYGLDRCVRVWDVGEQKATLNYTKNKNDVSCIKWSPNGKLISCNEKKGNFSLIDIRTKNSALQTICHRGVKSQNNCWVDDYT
jgi:WD40 repeat protein